jgi:hypothetical protein
MACCNLYAIGQRPTHGGGAMVSTEWFFNVIVIVIGLVSSVLIAMAVM